MEERRAGFYREDVGTGMAVEKMTEPKAYSALNRKRHAKPKRVIHMSGYCNI